MALSLYPAFTGLGAPYWNFDARGAIFGLTLGTNREHIVRATLESIAYQTADVLAAMKSDTGEPLIELRVDGGAAANNYLMQFQADILGIVVERPMQIETTGLGAAYLAGITVGVWKDVDELKIHREVESVFIPRMEAFLREVRLTQWRDAVKRLNWDADGT